MTDIIKEFEELSMMIENEILYRYDNLTNAMDSANTITARIENFLTQKLQQVREEALEECGHGADDYVCAFCQRDRRTN